MKKIIVFFALCFFLIGSVFPVGLLAEDSYYELSNGCNVMTRAIANGYYQSIASSGGVRVIQLYDGYYYYRRFISLIDTTITIKNSNSKPSATSCTSTTDLEFNPVVINGVTYYIYAPGKSTAQTYMMKDVPIVANYIESSALSSYTYKIENDTELSISGNTDEIAVYYAFGDGVSVLPTYGDLADIGYYTKIAGQGLSNVNNVDVITWNNILDSNGEFVSLKGYQAQVDIKAVSSHYTFPQINLQTIGWNDLVIDQNIEAELATQLFNQGSFSVSWGNVAAALDQSLEDLDPHLSNSTTQDWQSNGWVYYARLRVPDANYIGSWQLIYSTVSAPPSVTQTLTDPGGLTPEVINAIEQINIQNNTTNNWYIDNTEVPMNDTSDPQDRDSFWEKLLQALVSLVNNLINAIKDLLLGLLDLFRFDAFDIPDFEERKELYIEHTGLFGETLKFHESVKELLLGVEPAEPIFHYPGFVMNDVQLIPEMTINLNDYVEEQGFADLHAMAYTVTDGVIFLLLLLNVKNRIMEALSK